MHDHFQEKLLGHNNRRSVGHTDNFEFGEDSDNTSDEISFKRESVLALSYDEVSRQNLDELDEDVPRRERGNSLRVT